MAITILDGGLGQELMARSDAKPEPLWSAVTMQNEPELVAQVHLDFFKAGAEIATTNSYILHRDRLAVNGAEHLFESLNKTACEIANRARDQYGKGLIAGGIGPTGKSYRPDLALDVEQGAEVFAEVTGLQAAHVDFFLLETLASVKQAEGAVQGTKVHGKPVWLSLTVDDTDGSKLRSGEAVQDILPMLERHPVDALLFNCSTPEAISVALQQVSALSIPIGAYANGFTKITEDFKEIDATVETLTARQDLDPIRYADFAKGWLDANASLIGGCCEVGPAHIKELSDRFK
jgi:Homocysteine/selenocysteine methylase (S-methylmethionine-dependent)